MIRGMFTFTKYDRCMHSVCTLCAHRIVLTGQGAGEVAGCTGDGWIVGQGVGDITHSYTVLYNINSCIILLISSRVVGVH